MNSEKKKLLLDKVTVLCPNKRKLKYSNEYVLDKILLLLRDVTTWRSFSRIIPNTKVYHYSTIMKRFHKWNKAGVFKDTHAELLEDNVFTGINSSTTMECFIDATLIDNRNGIDKIGFGENRKKKATKLTAVCNNDKMVLDVICEYDHDANMVLPIVNSLSDKISFRKMNLVGDKGYKMNKGKLLELQKKHVRMHVPKRKNEKTKTSTKTKKHLRRRCGVENVFQQLKTFYRVRHRNEKQSNHYMGFVYLALIAKFT